MSVLGMTIRFAGMHVVMWLYGWFLRPHWSRLKTRRG
jgi:hypothetical protein